MVTPSNCPAKTGLKKVQCITQALSNPVSPSLTTWNLGDGRTVTSYGRIWSYVYDVREKQVAQPIIYDPATTYAALTIILSVWLFAFLALRKPRSRKGYTARRNGLAFLLFLLQAHYTVAAYQQGFNEQWLTSFGTTDGSPISPLMPNQLVASRLAARSLQESSNASQQQIGFHGDYHSQGHGHSYNDNTQGRAGQDFRSQLQPYTPTRQPSGSRSNKNNRHDHLNCPIEVAGGECPHRRGKHYEGLRSIADLLNHLAKYHGLLYCHICHETKLDSRKAWLIHHGQACPAHGDPNCDKSDCEGSTDPMGVCKRDLVPLPEKWKSEWLGWTRETMSHPDFAAQLMGLAGLANGNSENITVLDRWIQIFNMVRPGVQPDISRYKWTRPDVPESSSMSRATTNHSRTTPARQPLVTNPHYDLNDSSSAISDTSPTFGPQQDSHHQARAWNFDRHRSVSFTSTADSSLQSHPLSTQSSQRSHFTTLPSSIEQQSNRAKESSGSVRSTDSLWTARVPQPHRLERSVSSASYASFPEHSQSHQPLSYQSQQHMTPNLDAVMDTLVFEQDLADQIGNIPFQDEIYDPDTFNAEVDIGIMPSAMPVPLAAPAPVHNFSGPWAAIQDPRLVAAPMMPEQRASRVLRMKLLQFVNHLRTVDHRAQFPGPVDGEMYRSRKRLLERGAHFLNVLTEPSFIAVLEREQWPLCEAALNLEPHG